MPTTTSRTYGEVFAATLRGARLRANLTQGQAAERCGVTRTTIVRWESGRAERPDPDALRALCAALDLDLARAVIALGYLTADDLVCAA